MDTMLILALVIVVSISSLGIGCLISKIRTHFAFHLLILILICLPFAGLAQKFNAGIVAGGLVSQVDGDNWGGYHKFGFLAGGYVSLHVFKHNTWRIDSLTNLNDNIVYDSIRIQANSSFQMEIEYIQKGSRKNADLEKDDIYSYLLRLHYLEIALLYQYNFTKRFSLEAGPAADILLDYYEESDGYEVDNTVPLRGVTLSGILGVSGYITRHLKANFRFNYSLISIRNATAPYPPGYRKILFEWGQYNNVMSLSLFWDFKAHEF